MKRSLAAASSGPSCPSDHSATGDGSELVPLMVPAGGGDDESTSALPSTPSKALHDNNDANSDASTAARTVAVILDGMARAAILPFAPDLVGRVVSLPSLLDRNAAISAASGLGSMQGSDPSLWFALAAARSTHLVALYALGRAFGTYLGALPRVRLALNLSPNSSYFARAAGVTVALHLLTLGSGLQSLGAVRMVRFASAVLAGLLCKVTAPASAVGSSSAGANGASEGDAGQGDIKAATCDARGYLTGFALSSLTSGLAQPILVRSHLYRVLTGGRPLTLTPLFLLGVVAVVEIILGRLCAGCAGHGAGMPMFGGAVGGRGRGAAAAPVPQESSSRRRRSPTAILRSSLGGCRRRRRGGVGGDRGGAGEHVRWRRSPPSYNDFSSDGENDYAGPPGDTIALHEHNEFHDPRDAFHTPQQQFNRPRADSNHSAHSMHSARSDVFFDCASVNSDGIGIDEMMLDDDGERYDLEMGSAVPMADLGEADVSNAAHDDRRCGFAQQLVTRYVDRRCVHPDDGSSPSYVPPHCAPDTVPASYLQFCASNLSKAQSMWRATQQWRREQDVWRIHSLPHPHFAEIKSAYPHYIHGHSKKGYPIIYEHPGKMKLRGLFATGCTVDDMVHHYTYLMEYVANVLVEKEEIREARRRDGEEGLEPWGTMVVMDVSGASLSSLSGDVVRYLKRAGDTNSAHYPLTLKRAFVAHSPFWLSGAWSGIRGILPESVHVDLLSSSRQIGALREYIDDDQIPREYGGSSPYPLGEHPFELGLVRLVETQGRDAPCGDGDNGASRTDSAMESGTEGEASKSQPPAAHVGLESAPDSAATSASTSFDEEDGFLEDVPFTPEQGESIAHESTVRSRTGPLSRRRSSNASVGDSDGATALSSTLPLHYDAGQRGTGWDENGPSFRAEEERVLNVASLMHMAWCAVHGLIESTLGPWMLCSPILGGLGYGPGRTGVTVFCACVVLMWMSRTVVARLAWRTPCRSPMRAYRIGVGSLAVLLVILPTIPTAVTDVPKKDSVVVLASTMILLSCVVVAAVMGRYAAVLIHGLATASYAEKQFGAEYARPPSCCAERLRDCCRKGQLSTTFLGVAGEISGAMLAGSLFGWSTNQRRPFPFDGACCFYVSALFCALLYILSYSLHLDSNGKFASHSRSSADGHRKGDKGKKGSRCALVGEVATVAVSDMASLFEESNWSSSTALGLSRGQPARSLSSLE